jgi:subtilisin family serine protease
MQVPVVARRTVAALLPVTLIVLSACSDAPTAPSSTRRPLAPTASLAPSSGVILPRAVVVFKDTTAIPQAGLDLVARLGGTVVHRADEIGVAFVDGLSLAALTQLRTSDLVEGAAFDRLLSWLPTVRVGGVVDAGAKLGVAGDPWNASYFADGTEWGMRVIKADQAWRAGYLGAPTVRVAIVDTGIDYGNRELTGRVDLNTSAAFSQLIADAGGQEVTVPVEPQQPGDQPYMDNHFHGTHVASTVASNGISVAGVAPRVTLVAVKVLNFQGSGTFESVATGIRYASTTAHAHVINMSLGANVDRSEDGAPALLELMSRTIRYAERQGTIVISAAGNDHLDLDVGSVVSTPCEQSTICVSATGPLLQQNFDQPATYTNYGITAIDVAAPGGNASDDGNYVNEDLIIGACSRRTTEPGLAPCRASTDGVAYFYAYAAGTSMATPHVSGTAAMVKSLNPPMTVSALRQRILSTADDVGATGRDVYTNWGRINVWRAIKGS